jgi:L-fuconolactonase
MVARRPLESLNPKTMIIDTHTHVAVPCLLARTVGAIERNYPILPVTDLIHHMDQHGVSKAVLVQWGRSYDHHYLAQCLSTYPGRFAAVCDIDASRDDACDLLRCLVEKHGFRGVRLSTTDRSPGRDTLAIWKTAHDLGAVIAASATSSAEFVEGLTEVLSHIPAVTLRIEHLGRPPHHEPGLQHTFDGVLKFAEHPGTHINLDGFYSHHYPDSRQLTAFPYPEYQGFVRQAVAAFGPDRCMWGSEFPFINNGYDTALRFFNQVCDFLSENDREWILGKAGAVLWKL